MSNSLTQEQKDNIRKNLPLKIFERREDARTCLENIDYFGEVLSEAAKIDAPRERNVRNALVVTLSGKDAFGNELSASCNFYSEPFNKIRDCFTQSLSNAIKDRQQAYDQIPDAKIITVDFRNKKVDPDKKPEPLFKPRYDELPHGATAIYQGAKNICEALNMGFEPGDIPYLVKEKGLPAFKGNGKKHWYALRLDLRIWKQKEQGRINRDIR